MRLVLLETNQQKIKWKQQINNLNKFIYDLQQQ